MRIIKFRVWDKSLKKFIPFSNDTPLFSKEYVVQQFTGFVDKNHQEIFEGDIVKIDPNHMVNHDLFLNPREKFTAGEVKWLREGFSVCQANFDPTGICMYAVCFCCPCGLEIIGNNLENS